MTLNSQPIDQAVRSVLVISSDVEPDLGEIGFREFGDERLFQRPEARLARRSEASILRPRALIRLAVASSNGLSLRSRTW